MCSVNAVKAGQEDEVALDDIKAFLQGAFGKKEWPPL